MILDSFKEENGLVYTRWNTTTNTIWKNIVKGVKGILNTYNSYEVIIGSEGEQPLRVDINQDVPTKDVLVLTGQSKFFNGPVKLTFVNNGQTVDLLYTANLGFAVNYEAITRAFGPFMDTCEIIMVR